MIAFYIALVNIANSAFMIAMMQTTYLHSAIHVRLTVAGVMGALFFNAGWNIFSLLEGHPQGSVAELVLSIAILLRFVSHWFANQRACGSLSHFRP